MEKLVEKKQFSNIGLKINGKPLEDYNPKIHAILHKYFGHAFPYRKDILDMFSEKGLKINENWRIKVIGNVNNVYLQVIEKNEKFYSYSPTEFRNKFWLRNVKFPNSVKKWLEKLYAKYIDLAPEKPKRLFEIKTQNPRKLLGKDAVFCMRKRRYVLVDEICVECPSYQGLEKVYDFREKKFKRLHKCRS